jgi:hypothetical protein
MTKANTSACPSVQLRCHPEALGDCKILGPKFTDANDSPVPTSQESNRSRQLKKKKLATV